MIPWPPHGCVDRLFDETRVLRDVEGAILRVLEARGHQEIVLPLLERDGVFSSEEAVRFVDRHGDVLGLRPDFTGAVARVVASRLSTVKDVKLCYRGAVFRDRDERSSARRQVQQAGFERFGQGTPDEDADVLRAAFAVCDALGLTGVRASLGSAALLDALAPGADPTARRALDRRDRTTLPAAWEPLLSLSGDAAVLDEAQRALPAAARPALDRVRAVVEATAGLPVVVDLAEVRPWSYYTGPVFSLYADYIPRALAGGGRYDGLVGQFGASRPAVGLSFDVDVLVEHAVGATQRARAATATAKEPR